MRGRTINRIVTAQCHCPYKVWFDTKSLTWKRKGMFYSLLPFILYGLGSLLFVAGSVLCIVQKLGD